MASDHMMSSAARCQCSFLTCTNEPRTHSVSPRHNFFYWFQESRGQQDSLLEEIDQRADCLHAFLIQITAKQEKFRNLTPVAYSKRLLQ